MAAAGEAFLLADGVAACWFPGSNPSSLSEDDSLLSLSAFLGPPAGVLAAGVLAGVAAASGVFLAEGAAPPALVLGAAVTRAAGAVVVAGGFLGASPSSLSSLDSVVDPAEGVAPVGPGAAGGGALEGVEAALRGVLGVVGGASSSVPEDSVSLELSAAWAGLAAAASGVDGVAGVSLAALK